MLSSVHAEFYNREHLAGKCQVSTCDLGYSQTVDGVRLCAEHALEACKSNPIIQLTDPRVYEGLNSVGGDQGNVAKAAQLIGGSSLGQNKGGATTATLPVEDSQATLPPPGLWSVNPQSAVAVIFMAE